MKSGNGRRERETTQGNNCIIAPDDQEIVLAKQGETEKERERGRERERERESESESE